MSNLGTNASQLLAVSPPPFWHSGRTLQKTMLETILALMPAVLFALITWGLPALRVICLSISVCVATEALCQKWMKREIEVDNFSAVLAGLLLAFLLPAGAPSWLVIIAALLAMTLGKMAFGDLGAQPLSVPVVGYVLCYVSFPLYMDANTLQLTSEFVDPLVRLKYFGISGIENLSIYPFFFGQQLGGLGSSQGFMIFLGGCALCWRRIIRWEIAFSFIFGVLCFGTLFYLSNSQEYANPFFHLFTGSTMLGAFFLATDMSSSPNKFVNMLIYGFTGGVLVILIRTFGIYNDGVPFAILLINLIMPLLEGRKQKPFGME